MRKRKQIKTSKKKTPPTKSYGVRLSPKKKNEASGLKINIGKLFRETLDKEIQKMKGTCPTCGQKRKGLKR